MPMLFEGVEYGVLCVVLVVKWWLGGCKELMHILELFPCDLIHVFPVFVFDRLDQSFQAHCCTFRAIGKMGAGDNPLVGLAGGDGFFITR